MTTISQIEFPPESLIYGFKFRPDAPYRYLDAETNEYSLPGYIAQVHDFLNPNPEVVTMNEGGYTTMLDGTAEILVLDTQSCNIIVAGIILQKLALRMN